MASWDPIHQVNTLLIAQRDRGNHRFSYKLYPFFRRNDPDLGVFMAPLSMNFFENSQLEFSRIEYILAPRTPTNDDGDTILTAMDYYTALSQTSLV